MSWSAKRSGQVFHQLAEPEEVFVLGETARLSYPTHAALATAAELVAAAEARAIELKVEAERQASEIIAAAWQAADNVTATARQEGFAAGHSAAAAEVGDILALIRAAAVEGKAIRDGLAAQAATVVATATALAVRKLTGDFYEAAPARTAEICGEALRAASGQEVLSLRVNPAVVPAVQASLAGTASYVLPDELIEIGGCIVDLRHGTLDATLETRLSLMEIALQRAAGGMSQ